MNPLITTPPYVSTPIPSAKGQSFIVTGAAGSIGSEVCRRLIAEGAHVSGVDIDENGLTYLSDDLGPDFVPVISDITRWTPNNPFIGAGTFIHCAARKHVALGESHPAEYERVNVRGTLNVIRTAEDSHARMVLVSTDKAVEPTCVMGRTKRAAELYTLAYGHTVVRLVNVYGSRGSVVPRWRRQVDNGQPCTITDWNHRRFYMTAEHAAWTIIDAALGWCGAKVCVARDYAELTTRELYDAEFPDSYESGTIGFPVMSTQVIGPRPGERDHETLRYPFEGEDGDHGLSEAELKRVRRGDVEALAEA
jgi:FlaA1/EpsC-like NDP-sugar epimerase